MPQEYQHDRLGNNSYRSLGAKAFLLYLLPAPLIVKLIISILSVSLIKIVMTAGALFFFYSSAHLTRMTLVRQAQIKKQKRPDTPKDSRSLAAIFTAIGVLIVMLMIRKGIAISLLMPACAYIGYVLFYGLSPKTAKSTIDYDSMPNATREAIKGAYKNLAAIELLTKQLGKNDPDIKAMADKVLEQSYTIMDLLVKNPEDVGRARRFLNVYINRIKEILQQYLTLSSHGKVDNLRERILSTLTEVEQAFRTKQAELLDDDILKLDIQLEVLDEQIQQEQ